MNFGLLIFGTIFALIIISATINSIVSNKIFFRLESNYPPLHAQLGNPGSGGSKFNYAPQIWLLSGDYKSLNDLQINGWARLANITSIIFLIFVVSFFALLAYGRYRAGSM